jgi:signal transduction histidine kinase
MRELLDYGKPSVLRRAPTQLADVLRRAGRTCASLARDRKVTVEERLSGELPVLELDGARVEQAFENLLANAIQHSPPGSVVRIRADLDPEGPDPRIRCTVEDEGPGLREEDLGRLFEPFFSRRKGGTGLGLPIVRRVVEAHGGSVTAGNREGGGACFTVRLPAVREGEGLG